MRTLVHLSDLHFGRVNPLLVDPLIKSINEIGPDVVAISGDLTQRARSYQFKEARSFLDRLPKPQIVVPGNHDVPLHNVFARLLQPLTKYKRYITDDLQPTYEDEEVVIIGVNTARSLVVKGGRINETQVGRLRDKFCSLGNEVVKVVVTHHPFDLPEGHDERDLVGRAKMAMTGLAECGADLFLAGHLHISHTGHTKRYNIRGHSALVVQAGTSKD
jgi:3',5'-cyclic AMP phosphodiesterase CpdA